MLLGVLLPGNLPPRESIHATLYQHFRVHVCAQLIRCPLRVQFLVVPLYMSHCGGGQAIQFQRHKHTSGNVQQQKVWESTESTATWTRKEGGGGRGTRLLGLKWAQIPCRPLSTSSTCLVTRTDPRRWIHLCHIVSTFPCARVCVCTTDKVPPGYTIPCCIFVHVTLWRRTSSCSSLNCTKYVVWSCVN